MSDSRRPGQWPIEHPVHIDPAPAAAEDEPVAQAPVVVPVAKVKLVVTVDLTGRYDTAGQVSTDLHAQTHYSTDCHTAIVRLGADAVRVSTGLGSAIASRFFLAAREVEVHVPAGTRWAYVATETQHYMRLYAADHAEMLARTRAPG